MFSLVVCNGYEGSNCIHNIRDNHITPCQRVIRIFLQWLLHVSFYLHELELHGFCCFFFIYKINNYKTNSYYFYCEKSYTMLIILQGQFRHRWSTYALPFIWELYESYVDHVWRRCLYTMIISKVSKYCLILCVFLCGIYFFCCEF